MILVARFSISTEDDVSTRERQMQNDEMQHQKVLHLFLKRPVFKDKADQMKCDVALTV